MEFAITARRKEPSESASPLEVNHEEYKAFTKKDHMRIRNLSTSPPLPDEPDGGLFLGAMFLSSICRMNVNKRTKWVNPSNDVNNKRYEATPE